MIVTQATTAVRPPRELRADVPDDLEAVVLRCLARDPAGRYATAAALDAALAACADHGRWTAADAESWWRTHSPPTPAGGMSPDPAPSPSRAPTRVTIAAPQRGQ
jgi:serine/threonine-protein kinase